MADEDGPPAKRRRKGGIRQRISRAPNLDEDTPHDKEQHFAPSRLVKKLLKDFAWGAMSAQKVQDICMSSVKDLEALNKIVSGTEKWPANPIQNDQQAVATIGVSGQYANKCYSDLMQVVEPNITLPKPHRVRMKFARPLGEQIQEILLPREMFAAFFARKATWEKVVLPSSELALQFWQSQKSHPQWKGHPLEKMVPQQLKKVIPLSLHGDEVPVTGVGKQWSRKMVNFSWHSLLSTTASVRDSQFFIWALFDKAGVTEEQEGGYSTLWCFFEILAWSLEFLFKGIYPTHDVKGREQLSSIFVQLLCLICYRFVLRDLGVKANLILRAVEVLSFDYWLYFRLLLLALPSTRL